MARTRSYSTVERSPLASFSGGALTVSVLVGILFFVVNFPNLIKNRIVPSIESEFIRNLLTSLVFIATMPGAVYEFVQQYLTIVQPPIFDAALLFVLLVASSANVVIGVVSRGNDMEEGRAITFLSMEVTLIVFFLVAGIFILFAQAASEGN